MLFTIEARMREKSGEIFAGRKRHFRAVHLTCLKQFYAGGGFYHLFKYYLVSLCCLKGGSLYSRYQIDSLLFSVAVVLRPPLLTTHAVCVCFNPDTWWQDARLLHHLQQRGHSVVVFSGSRGH